MSDTLNILALDTAMNGCGVAVSAGGCVFFRSEPMPRGQAEALAPMMAEVMGEAGLAFGALDRVAVTVGPGAFTGLRIGMAAAQGLALALDIPLTGLTTFEVLALQYRRVRRDEAEKNILVLIETKRTDYYAQLFSAAGEALGDPAATDAAGVLALAGAEPAVAVGDAVARFLPECKERGLTVCAGPEILLPDPAAMIELARYGGGRPAVPFYLRPPDVSRPKGPMRRLGE